MIADQNFYDIFFTFFYPTASATAYGRKPKFVRAEHSAKAEGENCPYGPTLAKLHTHFVPEHGENTCIIPYLMRECKSL
jgi:hypothetical protein